MGNRYTDELDQALNRVVEKLVVVRRESRQATRDAIPSIHSALRESLQARSSAILWRFYLKEMNRAGRWIGISLVLLVVIICIPVAVALRVKRTEPRVARVPGFRLSRFLGHFCSKRFRENVLEAAHAEAIADYLEALADGDVTRSRIKRFMVWIVLLATVFSGALAWLFKKISFKFGASSD